MIIGFVIWSIASAVMLGIGIWSYRSKEPVGFFLTKAKERGIDVELFVRKNKDDKISKEFWGQYIEKGVLQNNADIYS